MYRDFNTHPSCLVVIDDDDYDDDDDNDDNAVVWTMDHLMYKLSNCYYRICGGEVKKGVIIVLPVFPSPAYKETGEAVIWFILTNVF